MSIEAMKQALEALEQSKTAVSYENFGMLHRTEVQNHEKAITALRQAIEQAEQAQPVAWERHAKELTKWLHCMSYNDSYFGEPPGLVKHLTAELNRLIGTAPPPRPPWVGLDEEDWDAILYEAGTFGMVIRVTEAKLKEKNK